MMSAARVTPPETASSAPAAASGTGLKRRGIMFVLASPPGGGKTTITRALIDRDPDTMVSVSATTRSMRPGEVEGKHYYFVDQNKFKRMIEDGEMLEHALVYNGQYYGTPKAPVEKALSEGRDVLFDIDWQGMRQLKAMAPEDVVSIFVLPPSWNTLEERLRGRGRDPEDDIKRRLEKAAAEISHYKEFQYVIINDDLDQSIEAVRGILTAERQKRHRLIGLHAFVDTLKPE